MLSTVMRPAVQRDPIIGPCSVLCWKNTTLRSIIQMCSPWPCCHLDGSRNHLQKSSREQQWEEKLGILQLPSEGEGVCSGAGIRKGRGCQPVSETTLLNGAPAPSTKDIPLASLLQFMGSQRVRHDLVTKQQHGLFAELTNRYALEMWV